MTQELKEKDLSVSMEKVNALALPFIAAIILLPIVFALVHGFPAIGKGFDRFFDFWIFLPVMIVGIVIHELIHGITWALFSPLGWKGISFGFQRKTLTPYAHCAAPLNIQHYRLGALMPGIVLGIVPFLIALAINLPMLAVGGFFFTLAAGGDFWVLYSLRREPASVVVKDHPSQAGCIVLYSE